jgi:hypothetical protein
VSPTATTLDLRYPIGTHTPPPVITSADIESAIATIATLPGSLRNATHDLTDARIDTPYRPGGWTVRQLIHHIADSHSTALIRVHLALTEDWPTVKPYDEAAWARLPDYAAPIAVSLNIIEGVHARWALLLNALDAAQWQHGFLHPERGASTLEQATLLYQWHSLHHLAHITELRRREGW